MSIYDSLIDYLHTNIEKKDVTKIPDVQKNRRPLKMPKDYDFSVRNVNWRSYSKDFILRTDAIWEKVKLKDLFYTHYKVNWK